MLRSLFIRSFFILVLPLSAGFAMQATEPLLKLRDSYNYAPKQDTTPQDTDIQASNMLGVSNMRPMSTQYLQINSNLAGNMRNSVYQGGETKQEKYTGNFTGYKNVKPGNEKINEGEEESEDEYSDDGQVPYYDKYSEFETVFRQPRATVGFFEGNDNYSKYAGMDSPRSFIFFYRRGTFLFFCPLLFNSLLNFIFEIDNKPSGGFFNFFSVGWRTLPFLNIITFDIHFNWFLFAVSAWFDFVYFIYFIRNEKLFSDGFNSRIFIPMLLCSFVFDAVSLCVNFKVDDYFYITVNLSYFLQRIVGGLFYQPLEEDLLSVAPTVSGFSSNDKREKPILEYKDKGNINIKNDRDNIGYNCSFNEENTNTRIVYKNNRGNNFDNNVYCNNNNNNVKNVKDHYNNSSYNSNMGNQDSENEEVKNSFASETTNPFVDHNINKNDMNQPISQVPNQQSIGNQNIMQFNEQPQEQYQGVNEDLRPELSEPIKVKEEQQYNDEEQYNEEEQYDNEEQYNNEEEQYNNEEEQYDNEEQYNNEEEQYNNEEEHQEQQNQGGEEQYEEEGNEGFVEGGEEQQQDPNVEVPNSGENQGEENNSEEENPEIEDSSNQEENKGAAGGNDGQESQNMGAETSSAAPEPVQPPQNPLESNGK